MTQEIKYGTEPKVEIPTGNWIQTYTGGKFYPMGPRPEHVYIKDIAHALSNQCRFAGHTREFYSVAQHSLIVSYECAPEDALWGLLHDAAEAYMCDLPRPIKYAEGLGAFKQLEKKIAAAITERFSLAPEEPESVKEADRRLLYTERRDLLPSLPWESDSWGMGLQANPFGFTIDPMTPKVAEDLFLFRFVYLISKQEGKCQTKGQ